MILSKSSLNKFLLISGLLLLIACSKGNTYPCQAGDPNIEGAECNDGYNSDATGQGACSHHDGVQYWRCCCEDE